MKHIQTPNQVGEDGFVMMKMKVVFDMEEWLFLLLER